MKIHPFDKFANRHPVAGALIIALAVAATIVWLTSPIWVLPVIIALEMHGFPWWLSASLAALVILHCVIFVEPDGY